MPHLESLQTPSRHKQEQWQRLQAVCREAFQKPSESKANHKCPELLSECIALGETALQELKGSPATGLQLFGGEGQHTTHGVPAGVFELFGSSGVAEPFSSSGSHGLPCSTGDADQCLSSGSGSTRKHTLFHLLFCTASFACDQQVRIALPLNILFTAQWSDVQFYHVTFGHDTALVEWMRWHLQWARALLHPGIYIHCLMVYL